MLTKSDHRGGLVLHPTLEQYPSAGTTSTSRGMDHGTFLQHVIKLCQHGQQIQGHHRYLCHPAGEA